MNNFEQQTQKLMAAAYAGVYGIADYYKAQVTSLEQQNLQLSNTNQQLVDEIKTLKRIIALQNPADLIKNEIGEVEQQFGV